MERLTGRTIYGIPYCKIPLNESMLGDGIEGTLRCWTGFIAERLTNYEETGFKPETLKQLLDENAQLRSQLAKLRDYQDTGKTPEQVAALEKQNAELRELLKLAVEDMGFPCDACKYNLSDGELCRNCKCDKWEWQHAERMEAAEVALKEDVE